jgi:IclR family transcriptional regulator, acetate operon repressor
LVGFSSASIDKALSVIELLASHPGGLPLLNIAEAINQPKGATHRIVTALVARGYVAQTAENKRYALTLRLAAIGVKLLEESQISEVCQPVLERLASSTGELVRMAVLEGERLIVVAKAQGTRSSLRYDPGNGRDIAVYATASGQCWLAQLPVKEAVRIAMDAGLGRDDLEPAAARTKKQLLTRLDQTRDRGFGQQIDEAEAHVSAIAVPLVEGFRGEKRMVGTLSVAGPSSRMPPERMHGMIPSIKEAAEEISALWPIRRRNTVSVSEAAV